MAINYFHLGRRPSAIFIVMGALTVTAGATYLMPDSPPPLVAMLMPLLLAGLTGLIAESLQQNDFKEHVKQGGKKGSLWIAVAVGIVSGGCLLGLSILAKSLPTPP